MDCDTANCLACSKKVRGLNLGSMFQYVRVKGFLDWARQGSFWGFAECPSHWPLAALGVVHFSIFGGIVRQSVCCRVPRVAIWSTAL